MRYRRWQKRIIFVKDAGLIHTSSDFIEWAATPGDSKHVMLYCPRFADERERLNNANVIIGPRNLVKETLLSEKGA